MTAHGRDKLLNLIVYFSKNTKNCYKIKLFKLLYYCDFEHFRQTGKPMVGLHYVTWKRGPVPQELWDELKSPKDDLRKYVNIRGEDERLHFIPKVSFDQRFFTEREIEIINNLACIYIDANADQMIESTHLRKSPWDTTRKQKGMGAEIDYRLAFDDSPGTVPIDVFKERQENEKIFHKLFG